MTSYRKYFTETLGVYTQIMHHKQEAPKELPFISLEYVNSNPAESTKLSDMISQDSFYTFGVHHRSLHELNELYESVKIILLYRNIPLLDSEGNQIALFKVEKITGESPMMGGDYERFSDHHRTYIDARLSIVSIKQEGLNEHYTG